MAEMCTYVALEDIEQARRLHMVVLNRQQCQDLGEKDGENNSGNNAGAALANGEVSRSSEQKRKSTWMKTRGADDMSAPLFSVNC
jgi:hypothetical protein